MKRLVALFLALVLCLAAAACVPAPKEPETVPAPERGKMDRSDLLYTDAIAGYEKTDWQAEWIWTKSCSDDSYVAFRKTFSLASAQNATAFISAADKYVLWVNGQLTVLDGSLKRGPTPYDSYYDTVELSLKEGENTIAVLCTFNGRSGDGSIVPVLVDEEGDEYNQAGFIFELKAGDTLIKSDSTWKAQRHGAYKNRVTGGTAYVKYEQSSMLAERNVFYMAADSLGDFTSPGYDDSAWEDATAISRAGDKPFGALYSAMTKPVQFEGYKDFANSADFVGKAFSADTTITLELPGNMQFTWYMELESEAGKTITVYTDTYTDRQELPNFKDTYVTAAGAQSYENYPWRSGSRLIMEVPAGVTFRRLCYRPSGAAGTWAGSFTSSDAALDQLWQESLNTIAICMRDSFMDCPERERGPYMGDASNQIDAALYSYDQGGLDMTKKAILACVAWTRTGGAIPSRAPSVKPQEIPNQSLAFMTSAYHYWLHSGDRDTMTAYYKAFAAYLKLFEMKDGLPKYRPGSWTWNDWGNRIDSDLLQAGYYYYALRLTKALAADLGITEDNAFLTERMESMEKNWHDAYYTAEGFKSAGSKYVDDRANALLALSGLAGPEDWPLITSVLESTCEASPFCEKYVLEALCVMGRQDLAIKRIKDRYAPMLTDRWDTLWEQFNDVTGTYNHGWSAAPLYILSKYVAGVQPTKAGFEKYEIVPSDALESYTCTVWTPRGEITVTRSGNSLTVKAISGGTLVKPNGERITLQEGEHSYAF
ncbi:MAG: alpha-L-rhamnosidase N-terminal domain-containing protein [Oscillospiraceae bacterium]|nr:alpha-L-rhamnosidase N-terminal domain-containing protein [Oscillospiraceae bacterium]